MAFGFYKKKGFCQPCYQGPLKYRGTDHFDHSRSSLQLLDIRGASMTTQPGKHRHTAEMNNYAAQSDRGPCSGTGLFSPPGQTSPTTGGCSSGFTYFYYRRSHAGTVVKHGHRGQVTPRMKALDEQNMNLQRFIM